MVSAVATWFPTNGMTDKNGGPTISKSALLLSPCLAWAHPKARWYDEKYSDTSDRDLGIEFHRLIDDYIRSNSDRQGPEEAAKGSKESP